MYGTFNLLDKIKKHLWFTSAEIKSIVIAILLLGFALGFDDGRQTFELMPWLSNIFEGLLIITLAILVRESVRRIYALQLGYKVEFKLWLMGLGFSIMLTVISFGKIVILVYGGMVAKILPRHRIGYFRYGLSYKDLGGIAFAANFSSIVLAMFFKFFQFLPSPLIDKAIWVNILFACINMIPIPPLDGSTIFFASRTGYVFSLFLILGASALLLKGSLLATIIIAPLIAGATALLYNLNMD